MSWCQHPIPVRRLTGSAAAGEGRHGSDTHFEIFRDGGRHTMTTLHVAVDGADTADGSAGRPFAAISRAAELAMPGDTVLGHAGEYREWVRPRRGGLSATRRITYQAAPGEHVVIKGSERVTGWEPEQGTVWRVSVPSALFGGWNPFA